MIVGASLAGAQAAQSLRRHGFDGAITVLGEEGHLPYDRPPLSKQFLAGAWDVDKLRLRAAEPAAPGIEWRTGQRVSGLSLGDRILHVHGGDDVGFDGLVIATGAAPRLLPGTAARAGVFTLRTLDDALALRAALDARPERVVVVGAGFIGAEVAATARQRGLEVTLVEAAAAPLARVLDAESGLAVAHLHRRHGVDVRLGVGVAGLAGDGPVEAVLLADGTAIEASVVVIGVGVEPRTGWLAGSGLVLDDGVVCDDTCRAAPAVVAAGDVCRWPHRRFGGRLLRVEQWDNAVEQGSYVGRRLLAEAAGEPIEPFEPVPWFWSDQYDRKIQLAGVPGPHREVVQGSLAEQRFVQLYGDGDRLVGVLAWNRPRHAIQGRQLIAEGATLQVARATLAG